MAAAFSKLALLLLVFALFVSEGCSGDPNTRKQKYFERGNHYLQQGKYPEAAIQFQNAIKIDPNFAPAHSQLAKTYVEQKLWPLAFSELSTRVLLDPKNLQAQLDLANFLFVAREFQEARVRAANILRDNPDNVDAQLVLATSDGELGNLDAAIEEAQQAVRMAEGKAVPYLALGLLQEKAGKLPAAEQNLQKAISLDPKFLSARLGLALFYQRRQQWQASEAQYRAAIESEPNSLISRTSLASLYFAWEKKDLAERTLQEAQRALPNEPAAAFLLGDYYLNNGESQKASTEFAALYNQHSKDLAVKKRYVQALLRNKQFDQAMKLSEEILKQYPADPEGLLSKGQALIMLEKPGEAIPILEAAVHANPEDPVAHFNLGFAYYKTGKLAGAETEWRETVRRKPSMIEAQENLTKLASQKGDLNLLKDSVSEWIKYAPSAPQAYLLRGIASMQTGQSASAEQDLRKAIELASPNADGEGKAVPYLALGLLQEKAGKLPAAEQNLQKAISVDPKFLSARMGLALFYQRRQQWQASEAQYR